MLFLVQPTGFEPVPLCLYEVYPDRQNANYPNADLPTLQALY